MGGRVSTYLSILPAESQNRWHAPFRLFALLLLLLLLLLLAWKCSGTRASTFAILVALWLLFVRLYLRGLFFLCYVILVCCTPVLDSFLPHWRNEVKS